MRSSEARAAASLFHVRLLNALSASIGLPTCRDLCFLEKFRETGLRLFSSPREGNFFCLNKNLHSMVGELNIKFTKETQNIRGCGNNEQAVSQRPLNKYFQSSCAYTTLKSS
ncbi:hypothetical protein BJ166DRAFT_519153 [Pestalotiopsis sp. NC0098]|nr:hypothetical protein BJ166DRAFT_519153 [Pestalotiopsis sp. NC0098]